MPESRTLILDSQTIKLLCVAGESFEQADIDAIRQVIPEALDIQEISDIGLQVANAVELQRPSRNGYSRGRRAENEAIFSLGAIAASNGDLVTAINAKSHLGRNKLNLSGYILALALGNIVKDSSETILRSIRET